MSVPVTRTAAGAHRVVVTGLGVLSSIGIGTKEFAEGLRVGRDGARPIQGFDTRGYQRVIGCEVVGFVPEGWVREQPVGELGRASQFCVAAARLAIEDAGVPIEWLRAGRGLIAVGSTDGESQFLDDLIQAEIAGGPERMAPEVVRRLAPHRLPLAVAREFRLPAVETETITTACASGNYAVGHAVDALRAGEVDYAIAGGADAMCRRTFTGFHRMGLLSPDHCRPFDAERQGILAAEGAGLMLLETLESALARGADVHAEILGYGLSCDANHAVTPQQEGVARCMAEGLADAGVAPGEVDLISAHGTGTKANDITEVAAIREVFGDEPPRTVSM